jgi:cytochrome c oxidase subunit IV
MPDKTNATIFGIGVNWISLFILAVLVILLALEFITAQFRVPRPLILVFAFMQAGIILYEYMHVKRLFKRGEKAPQAKNKR